MFVRKRSGELEEVKFDKITERVQALCDGLAVTPVLVSQKVASSIVPNISTQELDLLASHVAADMAVYHPDYNVLAGRISASNLQKSVQLRSKCFSDAMCALYQDPRGALLADDVFQFISENRDALNAAVQHQRDLDYDIFGMETLKRSYLLRSSSGEIIETPQYMHMRVAAGVHTGDLEKVLRMYHRLALRQYTHSTPTLFNSGSAKPQMASCFLLANNSDSIEGIFDTLKDCAMISKYAGGIGLHVHNVRSTGAYIVGTNGTSGGIVPFLKIYNETARAVNQAGKRNGAFAIYLEPHHPDVFQFIELRKSSGAEEFRTRDLFLALWISDLFMERVEQDLDWSLMDPSTAPGLEDVHGEAYRALYTRYEQENRASRTVKARQLWQAVMLAQIETGTPYILNKDQANAKSNQQNLGTIKSSNLCAEIIEYSSPEETACCNLASVSLSQVVLNGRVDYELLHQIAEEATENLNAVIDRSFYPTERARRSNERHRPLGLGVSGLHDVFFQLGLAFDDPEALEMNRRIFETLYHGALTASARLAEQHGPYESFEGSPAHSGKLQFDLWPDCELFYDDWDLLKQKIQKTGLRNSLLIALMPTASSATILGNTECFEIQTSNLYNRKVLSGEFTVVNKYLVRELSEAGLWSHDMAQKIMANDGSVLGIPEIPADVQRRYRTVWEYSQKIVIDAAAQRGPFVDQSQSMNLFIKAPTVAKLTAMYMYAWKRGLKTMCYYLRTRAATEAVKFTIKKENLTDCVMCSA